MELNGDYLVTFNDSRLMTVRDALRTYGTKSTYIGVFHQEVKRKIRESAITRGYPPRVFFSYRWESEDHRKWVYRLGTLFREKGYAVILDQLTLGQRPLDPIEVPDFVTNVACADIFLMVVTPGYVESAGVSEHPFDGLRLTTSSKRVAEVISHPPSVGGMEQLNSLRDGWVLDESQMAVSLANQGFPILMLGVLKEGNRLPKGCVYSNVIDVRQCWHDFEAVSALIPRYTGLSLSDGKFDEFRQIMRQATTLVDQREYRCLLILLDEHEEFRNTVEWSRFAAMACTKLGMHKRAAEESRRALKEFKNHAIT